MTRLHCLPASCQYAAYSASDVVSAAFLSLFPMELHLQRRLPFFAAIAVIVMQPAGWSLLPSVNLQVTAFETLPPIS